MNKFKFGDKVWHEKYGLCVITRSEPLRLYSIAHNHPAIAQIPWLISESELAPASDWVKCSERMPDCDDLRERPHKALFWIYCQLDGRNFVTRAYRRFQLGKWSWVNQLSFKHQMIFQDAAITHYMPIIEPTPPQD
ncbi:hypothetical protein [Vitreoscilla massiliensis]|uniref:hypothetical protein n=1 Tax=Vitreoscilla massiliensis TaxID=1689272 RepID=UPI00071CC648|nr:hypothetical protein [Vitreoscilla massiliensis]